MEILLNFEWRFEIFWRLSRSLASHKNLADNTFSLFLAFLLDLPMCPSFVTLAFSPVMARCLILSQLNYLLLSLSTVNTRFHVFRVLFTLSRDLIGPFVFAKTVRFSPFVNSVYYIYGEPTNL